VSYSHLRRWSCPRQHSRSNSGHKAVCTYAEGPESAPKSSASDLKVAQRTNSSHAGDMVTFRNVQMCDLRAAPNGLMSRKPLPHHAASAVLQAGYRFDECWWQTQLAVCTMFWCTLEQHFLPYSSSQICMRQPNGGRTEIVCLQRMAGHESESRRGRTDTSANMWQGSSFPRPGQGPDPGKSFQLGHVASYRTVPLSAPWSSRSPLGDVWTIWYANPVIHIGTRKLSWRYQQIFPWSHSSSLMLCEKWR